jgi:hypothetical protein
MTTEQLHDLINANAEAKALADAGNDRACAAVISAALPPTIGEYMLTERGVFKAFANPADAETVMQTLEAVAAANPADVPIGPVVKRALKWMQPNNGGVDVGNAALRQVLDGILQPSHAATIKALAEVPQTVSTDQVSAAWLRYRPGGKVTNA